MTPDPFAFARSGEGAEVSAPPRTAAAIKKLALAILLALPNYDLALSSLGSGERAKLGKGGAA
jgi:hypothetical protein